MPRTGTASCSIRVPHRFNARACMQHRCMVPARCRRLARRHVVAMRKPLNLFSRSSHISARVSLRFIHVREADSISLIHPVRGAIGVCTHAAASGPRSLHQGHAECLHAPTDVLRSTAITRRTSSCLAAASSTTCSSGARRPFISLQTASGSLQVIGNA